jgi:glucose/mannose transport system substrate-binding protein
VPVDIHMSTWIWYSKAAFKKAGIVKEPATPDELFAALDKLKAAGLIGLAHGGQPWQENILFQAMLANVGGKELYLQVLRDRNPRAIKSPAFKQVLLAFKRLQGYVDAGSPNRNWNDATAMLISGKAGVQIMGDWAKGEFAAARQTAGKDFGCIAGLGPGVPYLIQGDAFVFPKTKKPDAVRAQKLLATTMLAPAAQLEFNKLKGSLPILSNVDVGHGCVRAGRHGDPEGQVARGRHDRGVPHAGPERRAAGCADNVLEHAHAGGESAEGNRRGAGRLRAPRRRGRLSGGRVLSLPPHRQNG